jgi:hypothetical protein
MDVQPKASLSDQLKNSYATNFVQYLGAAKQLSRLMDSIVSSITRLRLCVIMRALLSRVVEMHSLLDGVPSPEIHALVHRLGLSIADVTLDRTPPCHNGATDQTARIRHLLTLFSPTHRRPVSVVENSVSSIFLNNPPSPRAPRLSSAPTSTRHAAATKIASTYRMVRARRAFKRMREEQYRFYGITPHVSRGGMRRREQSKLTLQKRKILQHVADEEFRRDSNKAHHEFETSAREKFVRNFVPLIETAFWEFREMNKGWLPESVTELITLVESGKSLRIDPDAKKKKPTEKKKKKLPPLPPVPTTLDLLRATLKTTIPTPAIDLFDESTFSHLSESDKARISDCVKKIVIADIIHPYINKHYPVPIDPPPPLVKETPDKSRTKPNSNSTPPVPLVYEEQDLIDLIKLGIVRMHVERESFPVPKHLRTSLTLDVCIPLVIGSSKLKQSVCIYGPPGWGKKSVVDFLIEQTNAVVFELSPTILRECRDPVETLVDKIVHVAKNVAPAIILIESVEDVTGGKRVGTKSKDPMAKYRTIATVVKERIQNLPIVLVTTVKTPDVDPAFFELMGTPGMRVPTWKLSLADRTGIIVKSLKSLLGLNDEFLCRHHTLPQSLAEVLDGLSIRDTVQVARSGIPKEITGKVDIRLPHFAPGLVQVEKTPKEIIQLWDQFHEKLGMPVAPVIQPKKTKRAPSS